MVHLKGLISSTRITLALIPGLGTMILLRMAIHRYRIDIEDAENRVQDCSVHGMYSCYDFIVVGAGSAGAVVASRLSENPDWNVLLLEAGADENALADIPVIFPILQTSSIDWQFTTEPGNYCHSMVDGKSKWPRGKVLGGSSVLNAMLYIRGNRRDYDNWAAMGNPGWSYEEVLPYFKKSEDMRIPDFINDSYHGHGGYLTIEHFKYTHPITEKILEAGKQLGYEVRDVNGEYQTGFTASHGTVREGLRCSTAKAFLRPASRRPNLHISMFSRVRKVLIYQKKAYGVLFEKDGKEHVVKASKEVILSAGSIQSPQLLMLSGVGDSKHLEEIGIHPIHDLPGVGQNLQDHVAMGGHSFLFDVPHNNETDYSFDMRNVMRLKSMVDFAFKHNGPLYSMPECEAMAFVKTKYANPADDYPDVQLFLAPAADNMDGGLFGKRANGINDDTYAQLYEDILFKPSYSVVPLILRPMSRGYIKLKDSDPLSPPLIYPNYYTHPQDIKIISEGARIAHALTQMPALRELNSRPNPRRNPGCEMHELMSDDHLECQARHHTLTLYHPVGTCSMAPEGVLGAVVSHTLQVHGIRHLRVVDASIMPSIVSGNTNAPTIMIAEKASDMIKEYWNTAPYRREDYCNLEHEEVQMVTSNRAKANEDMKNNTAEHNHTQVNIEGYDSEKTGLNQAKSGEKNNISESHIKNITSQKEEPRTEEEAMRVLLDPITEDEKNIVLPQEAQPQQPTYSIYNTYPMTRVYETKYKETNTPSLAVFPSVDPFGVYPQQYTSIIQHPILNAAPVYHPYPAFPPPILHPSNYPYIAEFPIPEEMLNYQDQYPILESYLPEQSYPLVQNNHWYREPVTPLNPFQVLRSNIPNFYRQPENIRTISSDE